MLVVWFFFGASCFHSLKPSTVNWCFGLVVCTFGQLIWPSRRKVTWNTLKLSDHYRWSTNQCTDIWLGCIWLWHTVTIPMSLITREWLWWSTTWRSSVENLGREAKQRSQDSPGTSRGTGLTSELHRSATWISWDFHGIFHVFFSSPSPWDI